ncbi:hypothetical protein EJV47_25750 [Hymenobacter gummosus]|uniref:Carbonic anhydrase n=1 Tax=Hymenobacter gummosus TaxID=1776032 RepID=A0A3S0QEA0_9BACT|nr:hypothetical protein [Hymenobacter gummosus]RTQ45285.1 hypothetical protein EJV47_25750 [Hymenobacter gummosus]
MNRQYPTDTSYLPPKNLLLISCIDLRLTDDLARFMDHENLTNRYDHVILAGASLGVSLSDEYKDWHRTDKPTQHLIDPAAWWAFLEQHIRIAVALHHIEDVYIVEHEQCGAYKTFVKPDLIGSKDPKIYRKREQEFQEKSAKALAQKIRATAYDRYDSEGKLENYKLNVHCFRMNLRGDVTKFHSEDGTSPQPATQGSIAQEQTMNV